MIDMAKALEILKKYNIKSEKDLKQELEKFKINTAIFTKPINELENVSI